MRLARSAVLLAVLIAAAACKEGQQAATRSASPTAERSPTPAETAITVGDTVSGVPEGYDPAPFSFTLLACIESTIAVHGPYADGYYTFTGQPGMKFLILQFRLDNPDVRQHDTPYISGGEVLTEPSGNFYRGWTPRLGVLSEEYAPRPATQEEIDRLWGDAGAFETLLPGESVTGSVAFEIPADATPIEADLVYVPAKVALEGQCRPQ